jgi:hypothetical protein
MNKKIVSICLVGLFLLLNVANVASLPREKIDERTPIDLSISANNKGKKDIESAITSNKRVTLGKVEIYGDGTNENSYVYADDNGFIKLDITGPTLVDFWVPYSIKCYGDSDAGLCQLHVAIHQDGWNISSPTLFEDNFTGVLKIENVSVNEGDSFTYQIYGEYISSSPNVLKTDAASGAGRFPTSRVTFVEKNSCPFLQKIIDWFPLLARLLQLPMFDKLLNQ